MKLTAASLALLAFTSVAFAGLPSTATIWNVEESRIIEADELLTAVQAVDQVVLGETHYQEEVQLAEAWLLKAFSDASPEEKPTLAWEFLNWSEREKSSRAYQLWNEGARTDDEFLAELLGPSLQNRLYLPLLQVAKSMSLPLLATNLTREEKRPVVRGGIPALDPELLPAGFALGEAAYEERFIAAMGGHGDPATLKNYFAAQCLTDDVIADHLARDLSTRRSLLVVGGFHTAYFDGTWARLKKRQPAVSRILIQLEKSESPLSEAEQRAFIRHEKYGKIADYVIFF